MTKYWLFTGGPVGRPTDSLKDARKKAINYIMDTGRASYTIVSAYDEPYDWLKNYKVIGLVERSDADYRWIPKDRMQKCWIMDRNGALKEKIARPRYA